MVRNGVVAHDIRTTSLLSYINNNKCQNLVLKFSGVGSAEGADKNSDYYDVANRH